MDMHTSQSGNVAINLGTDSPGTMAAESNMLTAFLNDSDSVSRQKWLQFQQLVPSAYGIPAADLFCEAYRLQEAGISENTKAA